MLYLEQRNIISRNKINDKMQKYKSKSEPNMK